MNHISFIPGPLQSINSRRPLLYTLWFIPLSPRSQPVNRFIRPLCGQHSNQSWQWNGQLVSRSCSLRLWFCCSWPFWVVWQFPWGKPLPVQASKRATVWSRDSLCPCRVLWVPLRFSSAFRTLLHRWASTVSVRHATRNRGRGLEWPIGTVRLALNVSQPTWPTKPNLSS